ncbi:MAG TPA: DUF4838 domain-containing protein [Spirochaetota bacterium]|nr:DUF4838 domain-containing protein [Spirochaetota bacterium]
MSGWHIRQIAAAALFALLSGTGPVIAEDAAPSVVRQAGAAGVRLDLTGDWRIVAPSHDRVARCAAAELAQALGRITRKRFPVISSGDRGGPAVVLSHGRDGDAFRWRAAADRVEISGDGARGLLYGVYDFLEALGCRWVEPGIRGERLPSGTSLTLARSFSRQAPSFKGRCLVIGHAAFLSDADGWTVWAARNRMNTVFVHVTTEALAFGAAPEKQWEKKRDAALELMKDRGMMIEYGGHRLASFLPRELFKKSPGMFRMAGGERTADFNLCPSSLEALAVIQRNAKEYFCEHPYADIFHAWPDDILGGGWCSCPNCARYTPSEQALLAVNAVAAVLQKVNPRAQLSFLSYYDTEEVPRKVKPLPNICMLWAPRKRCYAHALSVDACGVNAPRYTKGFEAQVNYFRARGGQPARVFEYYLDAILFKSVLPPLAVVMRRDLAFYRAAGAHTVQALMTGGFQWVSAQPNAWIFARLAWNADEDSGSLLMDFCASTFGKDAAAAMTSYYSSLEKAFALALEISPAMKLAEEQTPMLRLFDSPPVDLGDPFFEPPAELEKKAARVKDIYALIMRAEEDMESVRDSALPLAWRLERKSFELMKAWLSFDAARVGLYAGLSGGVPKDELLRRHGAAEKAMNAVFDWRREGITGSAYRDNFELMHAYFWRLRLDKIRYDHFEDGIGKIFVKYRAMARIGWLYFKLLRAYE